MGPVLQLGLLGEHRERAGGGVEFEVAEVGFDLFVDAHADTSPSSMVIV